MHMIQKNFMSWFPVRWGLFSLLVCAPQLFFAQELNDSTRTFRTGVSTTPKGTLQVSPLNPVSEKVTEYLPNPSVQLDSIPHFSLKGGHYLPYQVNPSLNFRGDFRTDGIFRQFSQGVLYGSGGQTSLPGIGRFNNASLGYQHAFNDHLSMQVNANAMKINMSHITGQAFSTSGALLYQASDRVAFKFFGSYDIGNSYGMGTRSYGATMSLDMSERFGMEMGVQRYYDAMRGRWETVPVVIPYYRFEKFTLGFDVGGVVYEILRNLVFDKNRNGEGGPTIMPPRVSIPIR